jgi:hypothetical protein
MAQETKVKVRLDTRQAKSQLSGLVRESARSAGKLTNNIRSVVGKGLGAVGLGTAIGTGISAVRGATESGIGDVVGESLGAAGKMMEEMFLGTLNEDARSSRRAREETIQAFGAIAGARNEIPPEARQFYNNIKSLRMDEERGRDLFETDTQMRGPGMDKIIDRIMGGFGKMVSEAMTRLIDAINPFSESK